MKISISTDCQAKLGEVLFGDREALLHLEGNEPNTDLERELLTAMHRFVKGETMGVDAPTDIVRKMRVLQQCRHMFERWLTPQELYMYRGERSTNPEIIKKCMGAKLAKLPGVEEPHYTFAWSYQPQNPIQSWTTTPFIAAVFSLDVVYSVGSESSYMKFLRGETSKAGRMLGDTQLPLVLRARTDKTFFGSKELGNRVASDLYRKQYLKQDEVYRIGSSLQVQAFVPQRWVDTHIRELQRHGVDIARGHF